jgi:hypothetical protein
VTSLYRNRSFRVKNIKFTDVISGGYFEARALLDISTESDVNISRPSSIYNLQFSLLCTNTEPFLADIPHERSSHEEVDTGKWTYIVSKQKDQTAQSYFILVDTTTILHTKYVFISTMTPFSTCVPSPGHITKI